MSELETCKEKLAHLQAALNKSISGILVINKDLKITFVNDYWAKMHGFETKELLGNTCSLFCGTEHAKTTMKDFLRKIDMHGSYVQEDEHIKKDKTILPIMLRGMKLENDQGYVFTGLDITAQKEKEKRLKGESQELKEINEVMVGREIKMKELKEKLEKCKKDCSCGAVEEHFGDTKS